MGRKLVTFSYKVKGNFSPNGLQKIFFSFHPKDKRQIEKIADDILSIADCAIFYHEDELNEDQIDIDDYTLKLKQMKCFVIIITTNYLYNESFSKNWEYSFAVKHNIPILPIMVESELETYFEIEMNRVAPEYGNIQLLKTKVKDKTELKYKEKLSRSINSILINNQEIEKIKKAFSGQIFLSYRKKDRKYAHELMNTIHNIFSLRNISIWYDEFILSGENWSNKIKDVLKKSDIFLLMVTPSILEYDNYILREEYPVARKFDKKIVCAKKTINSKVIFDEEKFRFLYPDVKSCIDGNNAKEIEKAFSELADYEESSAEKDYLIGLAFLNGIDVEKSNERGVVLVSNSAKKDFPAAINKMADMYWNGDGVKINYKNSILWRKKLVELYQNKCGANFNKDELESYSIALENLTVCLYSVGVYRESMQYGEQLIEFLKVNSKFFETFEIDKYLAQAYDLCGKNALKLGLFKKAYSYMEKYHTLMWKQYEEKPTIINLHNVSVSYGRLGDICYSVGDYQGTKEWYQKAVKIDKEIDEKLHTVDSAEALSKSLIVMGDVYIRNREYEIAEQYYSEVVILTKRILEAKDSPSERKEYGEALASKGTALLLKKNIVEAKHILTLAKDIFGQIEKENETIESQHGYSVVLNRCAKICEFENDLNGAMKYYKESLELRKNILKYIQTSQNIYGYALTEYYIAEIYRKKFDRINAKKSYEKVVMLLLPIILKDQKGDCRQVFYSAAFERFKLDTYSGKKYLKYAIDALKWFVDERPDDEQFRKQYVNCQRMYKRCYPD